MVNNFSKLVIIVFGLILLVSCKPSDKYTGDWYALSNSGEKVEIHFSKDKIMTINDENGNEETYEINQTAAGFQNNLGYYRVEIDEASHYVIFENKKDEDNAQLVKQTNHASDFEDVVGEILYKMNRDDFPTE
ncbi:uncharacterized protein YrzB (UPF0473 family) [Virgibacillus halotolerans]|uniref:hypothetical protein n=1 Tax=Virgibacillus halotolerans TaxID=1071053 RepID=UPI00195FDF0D|nr:hypothetical protein [Virgibacillus halotolerans]MBM7599177.1 uncharacterized protein YrzB (UPF0473 family) [Virgibacillus halotolerans]